MRAERVTGPESMHGEGAVWWSSWGGLCWLDMLEGDVLRLDASGAVEHPDLPFDEVVATRTAALGVER